VEVSGVSELPVVLTVDEPSKVGEARRITRTLARRLGFDETESGRVTLIATEMATNLHKHSRGGVLILRGLEGRDSVGIEILALDRGPGMADVGRCMADGFSTAGSPGNGLGAIVRLSSSFDIYSSTETGTAMMVRFQRKTASGPCGGGMQLGVVNVPLAGEVVCGDAWAVDEQRGRVVAMMVDGLGHGLLAADAAREAVECFRRHAGESPDLILRSAHESLRKTRGAAMAIASLELDRREVRFAGIGNISGVILSARGQKSTGMVSHNGIVGHNVRKVQEFIYPWPADSLLVLHSDGLGTHWQVGRYPGLAARHPCLVAGVLYRDYRRERDDVAVLAVSEGEAATP
jgi:anti-sigma regulatory factor (Ser/Thr protein kinase)